MYGVQLLRLPTGYWNWVDLGYLTPNGPPASRCITGPKIVMEDGKDFVFIQLHFTANLYSVYSLVKALDL